MSETLQNYIWLQKLFDKIRHLSKECEISFEAIRKEQTVEEIASGLVGVIEDVVKFVIEIRSIADEYSKLEEQLQKYQGDIRKHIGTQHQLRLYGESLQLQLEESECTRFDFLQKTRLMIADLKRQNQKLHEQNMQLKHRNDQVKQTVSRLDLRSKMITQESSKERGSKGKLQTFQVDLKKPYRNDTLQSVRTPSKQNEYKIKIEKKDGRQTQMPSNFHSERKKDIQRKVRQLVENRNTKKTLFENSSYHELYARHKTIASNAAHRRSLRKSVESRDGRFVSHQNLQEDVVQEELQT